MALTFTVESAFKHVQILNDEAIEAIGKSTDKVERRNFKNFYPYCCQQRSQ